MRLGKWSVNSGRPLGRTVGSCIRRWPSGPGRRGPPRRPSDAIAGAHGDWQRRPDVPLFLLVSITAMVWTLPILPYCCATDRYALQLQSHHVKGKGREKGRRTFNTGSKGKRGKTAWGDVGGGNVWHEREEWLIGYGACMPEESMWPPAVRHMS